MKIVLCLKCQSKASPADSTIDTSPMAIAFRCDICQNVFFVSENELEGGNDY